MGIKVINCSRHLFYYFTFIHGGDSLYGKGIDFFSGDRVVSNVNRSFPHFVLVRSPEDFENVIMHM